MKSALAAAQGVVRRPAKRPGSRRSRAPRKDAADGFSSARPDDRDPQPIGDVLAAWTGDRGWERPLAEGRLFSDWAGIVGPDVAAHCAPTALRDGELRIAAQSTAWATQLGLLRATLLARIVDEVGPDLVTKLVITGPTGPSWKHGRLAVPGARGPRDTYG